VTAGTDELVAITLVTTGWLVLSVALAHAGRSDPASVQRPIENRTSGYLPKPSGPVNQRPATIRRWHPTLNHR
jgi:hypothetical protein